MQSGGDESSLNLRARGDSLRGTVGGGTAGASKKGLAGGVEEFSVNFGVRGEDCERERA